MDQFEAKFASQEDEDNFSLNFEKLCEEKKQILISELKQSGRYIDVAAKKLDDLDALTIAFYIHECRTEIKVFHIGSNNFTDRGLIDMLSALQWQLQLQEIYMGNNSFTELGIEAFVSQVSSFKQLRILSMGNCGVTDVNFIQLCYQLSSLPDLQQLCVPSNQISDFGIICVSSLLTTQSLSSIRVLHLGQNPITTNSLGLLFMALEKNKTLRVLYLNDIGLDLVSVRALAQCIKRNSNLQEIHLGNTGFSDQASALLWAALPLSNIKVLQLWSNHLTDTSLIALVDLIEEYKQLPLEYIGLQDNAIQDEELLSIVNEILKQNEIVQGMTKRKLQKDDEPPNSDSEESGEEENQEMELIDSGLQETNELEQSVLELEQSVLQSIQFIQYQQFIRVEEQEDGEFILTQQPIGEGNELDNIIDNPLQGKLKELRWTGEERDYENTIHSIMK